MQHEEKKNGWRNESFIIKDMKTYFIWLLYSYCGRPVLIIRKTLAVFWYDSTNINMQCTLCMAKVYKFLMSKNWTHNIDRYLRHDASLQLASSSNEIFYTNRKIREPTSRARGKTVCWIFYVWHWTVHRCNVPNFHYKIKKYLKSEF